MSLASVNTDFPAQYVLEVNRDWAKRNGVMVGQKLKTDLNELAHTNDWYEPNFIAQDNEENFGASDEAVKKAQQEGFV